MRDNAGEREFLTHWLAGSLGADEHIIAAFRGYTGPSARWDLAAATLVPALTVAAAWHDLFGGPVSVRPDLAIAMLLSLAPIAGATASIVWRKPVYVAVTEWQIIVVRQRGAEKQARLLAAAPIAALQLTTNRRLARRTMTLAATDGGLLARGRYRARLRITAICRWSRFDEAIDAIRALGGSVDLPPLPAIPVPGPP